MKEPPSLPTPRDPKWPRYSDRPFPPYRFVPRLAPHPYRDPEGHSFGRGVPKVTAFAPDAWRTAEDYLLGIDYYNFAFWWEAHEILEEIWHKVGHRTEQGRFLQGLIQVAAGLLHRAAGHPKTFRLQIGKGLERLATVSDPFMGVAVAPLIGEFEAVLAHPSRPYPLIRLDGTTSRVAT